MSHHPSRIFKGLKKWFLTEEEMAQSKKEHDEAVELYEKVKQKMAEKKKTSDAE